MKDFVKRNYVNIIIAVLALFNITVHLITSYNLEYHRDELLYFSLGLHPRFGYATVPPMIGWIAWLMQNVFGYSIFAVRLFPALLSGVMIFLVSALTKELGGSGYARILAGAGILISIFSLRAFLLFQPVHIDIILWTLSIYLIIKYINSDSDKYLILFGLTAGLAFLNKYLIGLLFLSFLFVVPFTQHRHIFTRKKFWLGITAGTLVFLPNLIWQFANRLPVINHFSELARTQLVNVDRVSFLIEQLLLPGTTSILTVAGFIYIFVNKSIRRLRFLGVSALLIIITLMLLQGKSYYTMGVFPFLIAAGAVSWDKLLERAWLKLLLVVIMIILTLPMLPIGIPVYKTNGLISYFSKLEEKYGMTFIRRFEDGSIHSLPQDYADMLGWEELAEIASKAWQMIPDKESGMIYCENYGQAGAITVIGKKYGLPEAISFHESFRYWIPDRFDREIRHGIYINDEMGEDVRSLFRSITVVGSISNQHAREFGTTVWLCEDPVVDFNEFWSERLKQLE